MRKTGYNIFAAVTAAYNIVFVLAAIIFVPRMFWDMAERNTCIGAMAAGSAALLIIALLLGKRLGERQRALMFVSTGLAGLVAFRWLLMALLW